MKTLEKCVQAILGVGVVSRADPHTRGSVFVFWEKCQDNTIMNKGTVSTFVIYTPTKHSNLLS